MRVTEIVFAYENEDALLCVRKVLTSLLSLLVYYRKRTTEIPRALCAQHLVSPLMLILSPYRPIDPRVHVRIPICICVYWFKHVHIPDVTVA